MIPKFLRRRVYKRLLKDGEKSEFFLCHQIKDYFPFMGLSHYPEVYNRRHMLGKNTVKPFDSHEERMEFIREALKLTL